VTKSPEHPPSPVSPATKSTLIGVSPPSLAPSSAAASVKSTLIGMSSQSVAPSAPSNAPAGSVKSTLIGMSSQSVQPPAPALASVEREARGVLPTGAVFDGRYRVARVIGRGRLGTVYAAEALSSAMPRALKVLKPTTGDAGVVDARVLEDLRAVESVVNDHVATVFDAGRAEGGGVWFATELLEGATLGQYAGFSGRESLTRRDVWRVLLQSAVGLEAAHAAGLVHRDLRPSNVFLATQRSGGFRVKLLDFGVGHRVEWDRAQGGVDVGGAWVAPECVSGAVVTPGADFWSFGLLAFWLFTGRSYWPSGRARLDAPLVLASERCAELSLPRRLPDGFDAWFEQCVARTPRDRFQTAGQLSRGLLDLFLASPEHDDGGFVSPVIVDARDETAAAPSVMERDSPAPTARTATKLPPPVAPSLPPAEVEHEAPAREVTPEGAGLLDDDDVRVVAEAKGMTADEAQRTAAAMRATRDPLRLSIPFERPAPPVASAPSRTAISAPFHAVHEAEADAVLEEVASAVLRVSALETQPRAVTSEPPARYPVPLVSTRRMPSIQPTQSRVARVGAALFAGTCGVLGIAWAIASNEASPTVYVATPMAPSHRVADDAQVPAPTYAHLDARAVTDASIAAAAPVAYDASTPPAPVSSLTMHGWADETIRAWTGTLVVPRARYGFTLALRRRHRFAVAGFFNWDLGGAQVRENVAGTWDPSSGLLRVHGTSSSDPLRMPVGAYALHVTRAGELEGSTMVRAARLTGRLDDDVAARVSTFLMPDAATPRPLRTSAARGAARPSRP
jgi:serine/threonine protein kinase